MLKYVGKYREVIRVKIPYARYKVNLDDSDYVYVNSPALHAPHVGYLLCPNPSCPAEVYWSAVSPGCKRHPFLKCKNLLDHLPECPFKTEYHVRNLLELSRKELDENFPEWKVTASLNRALNRYFILETPPPNYPGTPPSDDPSVPEQRYHIMFFRSSEFLKAVIRGVASVGGIVSDIKKIYEVPSNKHVYINFDESIERVSIHFNSKFFKKHPEVEAFVERLDTAKKEADKLGMDFVCIAFGMVVPAYTKRGIRVLPRTLPSVIYSAIPKHKHL